MDKLSTDSRLGSSLHEQRKRARWTQAELARHAGLTAKTVGLLSAGAATSTPGMRCFEPSGFVCRAGTCPLAQRSACASRRFAAAGGSRKKPSALCRREQADAWRTGAR